MDDDLLEINIDEESLDEACLAGCSNFKLTTYKGFDKYLY